MYSLTQPCQRGKRCHRWRICPDCAAIRQKTIADSAELIEQQHGPLWITTIKPEKNTEAAIRAVHAAMLRNKLAPAGLWTIETGEKFAGLHLNIISPQPTIPRTLARFTWTEQLDTTARAAAAYISKQSGYPPASQYKGKLYGTFGNIRDLVQMPDAPILVQCASLEMQISKKPPPQQLPPEGVAIVGAFQPPKKTRAEYMEIARAHLPNLWPMVEKQRNRLMQPAGYSPRSIAS